MISAFGVEHDHIAKKAVRTEDEQLAHSLRVQRLGGIAGGTIGFTALGAKGASVVLRRAGKATRLVPKLESTVSGSLVGGAGLGGAGALYGAKVSGEQSRQAMRISNTHQKGRS